MDGKDDFRYEIQIGCRYVVSVFKSSFYLHLSGRTGCVIRHLPKRRISPKILVIIMGIVVLYLVLQKCGGRTIPTPTNSWKIETTVTTGARAMGILAEEEEMGWSGKDELMRRFRISCIFSFYQEKVSTIRFINWPILWCDIEYPRR